MSYVMKRYDGIAWVPAVKRYWDGSKWVGVDGASDVILQPDDISGLRTWMKADSLELSDGAAVSSWPDSGPDGDTASQGTASKQPTYHASIINGKPVVRFDGGDNLEFTGLMNYTEGNHSVFAVLKDSVNDGTYRGLWVSDAGGAVYVTFGDGSTGWGVWAGESVSYGSVVGANFRIISALVTWDATSAEIDLNMDGVSVQRTNGTEYTGSRLVAILGAGQVSGQFFNGDLAEFFIYDRRLTDDERNGMVAYLNDKYAVY